MTPTMTEHVIAGLLLLARMGDIGSTYLATPQLLLEANPVARRLRWPFAVATLFVALLPYWMLSAGIMVLAASLLVTASNFGKVWLMRTMGEAAYFDFVCKLAAQSNPILPLVFTGLAAIAIAALGGSLLLFYPSESEPAYWFAQGFITYAVVTVAWGGHSYWRMRRLGQDQKQRGESAH